MECKFELRGRERMPAHCKEIRWHKPGMRQMMRVGFVETTPGAPINILPPTVCGLFQDTWERWWADQLKAFVLKQLGEQDDGSRPFVCQTGLSATEYRDHVEAVKDDE